MLELERDLIKDIDGEAIDRLTKTKTYNYGIKFLDDATDGFSNGEVIIIGSKTGRGKTQLCNLIAENSARAGRKVLYLALEAEEREVGRRIKFRNLCKRYYAENPEAHTISFNKWRTGKSENELSYYYQEVERDLKTFGENLIIKYRQANFNRGDIKTAYFNYAEEVDLIVLDHLSFVDFDEDNDNRGLKETIKVIRDMNLLHNVPIIVVVHLRKTDKKTTGLIPDEEDIMGSSDVAKIATTIIMMNSSFQFSNGQDHLIKTYFRIAKSRAGSQATPYIAELVYNNKLSDYEPKYRLGKYDYFLKAFEEAKVLPNWYSYKSAFLEAINGF